MKTFGQFIREDFSKDIQDIFASYMNEKTMEVWRGLDGVEWSDSYAKKQNIIWVTPDWEYARKYADSELRMYKFKATVNNPFDFHYRTLNVHVKLDDMLSRIKVDVNELFGKKKISRDTGLAIFKELEKISKKYNRYLTQMNKVWEWWDTVPELVKVLKMAGYDSITALEDNANNVRTYGVFDYRRLKKN